QVKLCSAIGDMGFLSNHVRSVKPLRPGMYQMLQYVMVFLVYGRFATVHTKKKLQINAVEAVRLEDFSVEVCTSGPIWIFFSVRHSHFFHSIRVNLQEALKVTSGTGSEEHK
ncbi:hypothetical protein C8R41DRAFT_724573, partial [Lentinula lateritia]